ncbi:MepB family protein [Leptospira sp. 201903070]|uniref:MepB family protein n=1 Tax=Leptospira ainlahdjerensis TaxID=2810033 RepID=A0ABS2UBD7_9LEPT|nr:MepB family protein [Leptospira ainlahdjerensis]MBM9577677.1 MepB family protein [Leptospira ainlahdjerensis]MBM9577743.1 MepB family protein [Leptospira ainlahdjerensis]
MEDGQALEKYIFPNAFEEFRRKVLDPLELEAARFFIEKESLEYAACFFELKNQKIVFRSAKITPTKAGQFVTLWKRKKGGPIEPYHIQDDVDYYIVLANLPNRSGQFIFPKEALYEHGILSGKKEGKRGFRIYPPWDLSLNKQAQKTQIWQSNYFMENVADLEIDRKNFLNLLGLGE